VNHLATGLRAQLPAVLAKGFSASSRDRGEKYFMAKRVKIRLGSPSEVGARVQGSDLYSVTLKWSNGKLSAGCDCPFFAEHGNLCKHIWATILEAWEQGHLSEVTRGPSELESSGATTTTGGGSGLSAPLEIDKSGRVEELDRFEQLRQIHQATRTSPPVRLPAWKEQLNRIASTAAPIQTSAQAWPARSEIVYILDLPRSGATGALALGIASRGRTKEGDLKNVPKPCSMSHSRIQALPDQEDREILTLLIGADSYGFYGGYDRGSDSFSLSPLMVQTVLPRVVRTGRCFLPFAKEEIEKTALVWDDGEPWRFVLEVRGSQPNGWQLTGDFRCGERRMGVNEPLLASVGGILVLRDSVARLADDATIAWIAALRKNGSIVVPEEEREEFLGSLLGSPTLPAIDLPEEWGYQEVVVPPQPRLQISAPAKSYGRINPRMTAELSFEYEGRSVAEKTTSRGIYDPSTRRFMRRDGAQEKSAIEQMQEAGIRFTAGSWSGAKEWTLTPNKLPQIVRTLTESGWKVTAAGKLFRQPGNSSVSVASGVDWFELHGAVAYGETTAPLPKLLAALKRGETMVTLDDGSYGLLPEEWLSRFGHVATMGEADGDHIRFRPSQAGVLDALLMAQPTVDCDEAFRRVRKELALFASIDPAEQPAGFNGCLRGYQREGLGWMHFLRQFSFGGCLADDMGVGKTAQVLALLESRRELRAQAQVEAPSLVVVPKSLIFNWKQEAQRFTPKVRVLDYTGVARSITREKDEFSSYDVILTTYGTLRRDALHFKDKVFDYVILDEAQAIKNGNTESAKAARLLRANHRLALSGTPVENHLGELWSLFEFLNPGMLGTSGAFPLASASRQDPDGETRKLLSRALRPFLLRRTKEQVATELPPKIEQTIYCEMETRQRAMYNELRDHYREALLHKIGAEGIRKSKIQVLEALLRLRQAACHPGLVDRKLVKDPSAKLGVLMEQLRAVMEEGHKALVFSQFTSLLAIVRASLESDGIEYEYLDGKTVDRQARVEHFQQDPGCSLFLISLKAGGVGLNLTAADYVFILDPWWNPAVEAQAVDRTHRIGQVRQVFAYRLIARDTVEEKVLQLQETKRNLADAIIGAENSLIRDLTREDIELLLS
jgi:SNF2-related domain/Helicase conserved C-terminal domain/Bacterial SNF2 helicase associated/SWIM zinc finger